MKKMWKIGLLSLSLLSLLWVFFFTAMNVSADTKTVEVKIKEWTCGCTWQKVDFWTSDVKAVDQTATTTTYIDCSIMKWTGQKVTYQVTTLTWQSSTKVIPANKVEIKWTAVTQTWSMNTTALPASYTPFSATAITVYSKLANTVGVIHETFDMKITIPGWQAPDKYVWSWVVTCENL